MPGGATRWACALVMLGGLMAGCDVVLGLDVREEVEGPLTATCPPLGGTPVFEPVTRDLVYRRCYHYTLTEAGDLAVLSCADREGVTVEAGPPGGPFEPVAITPSKTDAVIERPALFPAGDRLLAREQLPGTSDLRYGTYVRTTTGWGWEGEILVVPDGLTYVGVPSGGATPRVIASHYASGYRELALQGGAWTEVGGGTWAELGATSGAQVNLSPDGLRLTFIDTAQMDVLYADRASLDDPFTPARPLVGLPVNVGVFLRHDCGQIFFTASDTVMYRNAAP